MGFTSDEDEGRLPDITASITNIGVDYREYENGNEESRLVVIWDPEDENFSTQTEILSTYHLLEVKPEAETIRVGSPENGFDLELMGSVITKGVLGYKAAVWMKQLEELGVKVPSGTGNLRELIGLRAVLRQMTYSEVKGREKKDNEKPFWVAVEILETVKAPVAEEEKEEDDLLITPEVSLHDALVSFAPGKSEAEITEWFQGSEYIGDDGGVFPLLIALDAEIEGGYLKIEDGVYKRMKLDEEEEEDDLRPEHKRPLKKALIAVAPNKGEKELVDWFADSVYVEKDGSIGPLFVGLKELVEEGHLAIEDSVYIRTKGDEEKEGEDK